MKSILKVLIVVAIFLGITACQQNTSGKKQVGIVVPMEHQALQEIVAGFSTTLEQIYHQPVQIKVLNAQGDINLQRAMIQQLHDQHYDLIVPVATGVTQMTAAMIHDRPIVSLAADFSEQERAKLHPCNITVVQDDIPPSQLIKFLHAAYPHLTQLTLIHSTSDKIFPDVKETVASGKQNGIEVKTLMVASLPELVSITQALPKDTQALFILKDNLMASGIATLVKAANERHIPLFTSDNGTVESGAGFALGVHERQIGAEGAKLAARVLTGKSPAELPIVDMSQLIVFVNPDALKKEKQTLQPITLAAQKLNYSVELMQEKK